MIRTCVGRESIYFVRRRRRRRGNRKKEKKTTKVSCISKGDRRGMERAACSKRVFDGGKKSHERPQGRKLGVTERKNGAKWLGSVTRGGWERKSAAGGKWTLLQKNCEYFTRGMEGLPREDTVVAVTPTKQKKRDSLPNSGGGIKRGKKRRTVLGEGEKTVALLTVRKGGLDKNI